MHAPMNAHILSCRRSRSLMKNRTFNESNYKLLMRTYHFQFHFHFPGDINALLTHLFDCIQLSFINTNGRKNS